jgi:hypothetical protein
MGGLRTETLRKGEENALAYYYWLVAGTTDSQLGEGVKQQQKNNRLMSGLNSPMGTVHGLSKYPYIREGRRIIGRPSWGQPGGFTIWETDISRRNYKDKYYRQILTAEAYRRLQATLASWKAGSVHQQTSIQIGIALSLSVFVLITISFEKSGNGHLRSKHYRPRGSFMLFLVGLALAVVRSLWLVVSPTL